MAAQPPRHHHPLMVEQGTTNVGGGAAAYRYHPVSVAGDTTHAKIFVGGLAWETQRDTMRRYFEQFGDILEAVVITDKHTGRRVLELGCNTLRDTPILLITLKTTAQAQGSV